MYKYELHCHTARTSACGSMSAEDVVDLYLSNGYDGVVITDHFLNGNTTVNKELPHGTYEQKIDLFLQGYEQVKKAAKDRLRVFLGIEVTYLGTDILIYGFDRKSLMACPELPDMDFRTLARFCRERGLLAVQAHPFREAGYIDHIRLYPDCEGVETLNAARNSLCNDLGAYYARSYGKIAIGGSHIHHLTQKMLSGMAFDEEAKDIGQLIRLIREGKGQIIHQVNSYIKK